MEAEYIAHEYHTETISNLTEAIKMNAGSMA
jgi:hypothetical protein